MSEDVKKNGWGGKRNGAGRKSSGIGAKSINMSIRVSAEEKAIIDEKARKAGKTTTRFIVDTILEI